MRKHKKCFLISFFFFSRDDKIRTCDLYVPNVARYQLRHIPSFLRVQIYLFFRKNIEVYHVFFF